MVVRFAASFPPETMEDTVSTLLTAEEMGYDGAWFPDSHLLWRESYTSLAYYATRTKRIKLGLAVTNVLTRHPSIVASAAATLNEISRNRFILGIGSGLSGVGTIGLRKASLSQMEESIEMIKSLMRGESVRIRANSEGFRTQQVQASVAEMKLHWKPLPPPVYISAHGPKMLRMAGKIADGVIYSLGALPDMVRFVDGQVSKGMEDGKRTVGSVMKWCRVGVALGEDKKETYDEVRPYVATVETNLALLKSPTANVPELLKSEITNTLDSYDISEHMQKEAQHAQAVSDRAVRELAVVGTPSQCLDKIESLRKAGATNFNLVLFTAREKKKLLTRFSEEVIAQLRP